MYQILIFKITFFFNGWIWAISSSIKIVFNTNSY